MNKEDVMEENSCYCGGCPRYFRCLVPADYSPVLASDYAFGRNWDAADCLWMFELPLKTGRLGWVLAFAAAHHNSQLDFDAWVNGTEEYKIEPGDIALI